MAHVTVMEWERTLLFQDGALQQVLGTGRHSFSKRRARLVTVDMRVRQSAVAGQELLTADGVSVRVSVSLSWQVDDPRAYVLGAESAPEVLHGAVQESIRAVVAGVTLDEALTDRGRLSQGLADAVSTGVAPVGIRILSAQARDLMLPGELKRAAMDVVVARERGRAELERARSEAAALRALLNAARLLDEHPGLLHLRTLQAAAQPGATVVLSAAPPPRES